MKNDCLDFAGFHDDPPGFYSPVQPFEVILHLDGFTPDALAHYTMELGQNPWLPNCSGGWDSTAVTDLIAPFDPECPFCDDYIGSWPPAECYDGLYLVLGPNDAVPGGIVTHFYFGPPWGCYSDFYGVLAPVPPPN